MYENNPGAKSRGPLSIAVPGELAGLHEAWLKYGRLKWKTLFQPAIRLAKYGFEVAPFLAEAIAGNTEKIKADPGLSKLFAPDGELLQAGDICYNVELGCTLEAVAKQGPRALYEGKIGKNLVKDVKDAGGILTIEDLKNFTVDHPEPVTVNAMDYTILGMPPPSTGTLGLSLVLNIFDSYGDPEASKRDRDDIELSDEKKISYLRGAINWRLRSTVLSASSLCKTLKTTVFGNKGKILTVFHGTLTAVSDPRKDGKPAEL